MKNHNKSITKVKIKEEPLSENDSSPKTRKKASAIKDLNNLSREELISLILTKQNSQTKTNTLVNTKKRKNSELNNGSSAKKIKIEPNSNESADSNNFSVIKDSLKKSLKSPRKHSTSISEGSKLLKSSRKPQIITSTPYRVQIQSDSDTSASGFNTRHKRGRKPKLVSQAGASESSLDEEQFKLGVGSSLKSITAQKSTSGNSSCDEKVSSENNVVSVSNSGSIGFKVASLKTPDQENHLRMNNGTSQKVGSGFKPCSDNLKVEERIIAARKRLSKSRNKDYFPQPVRIKMEKDGRLLQPPVPAPINSSEDSIISEESGNSDQEPEIVERTLSVSQDSIESQSSGSESSSDKQPVAKLIEKKTVPVPRPLKGTIKSSKPNPVSESETSSSSDDEPRSQKKNKQLEKLGPLSKPLEKEQSSESESSSEEEPQLEIVKKKMTRIQRKSSPIQKGYSSDFRSSSDKVEISKKMGTLTKFLPEAIKKRETTSESGSSSEEQQKITNKKSVLVPKPIKKRQSSESESESKSSSEEEPAPKVANRKAVLVPKLIKKHPSSESKSSSEEEPAPKAANRKSVLVQKPIKKRQSSESGSSSEEQKKIAKKTLVSVPKPIKKRQSSESGSESKSSSEEEPAPEVANSKSVLAPKPIKKRQSSESGSSSEEQQKIAKKTSVSVPKPIKKRQSSESGSASKSSSEEEPAPIVANRKSVLAPRPIKKRQSSESGSSSEEQQKISNKISVSVPKPIKKRQSSESGSESKSSSEEEPAPIVANRKSVLVPKPIKKRQSSKSGSSSEEQQKIANKISVSVPKPIKKRHSSESRKSSQKQLRSEVATKNSVLVKTQQSSASRSSSEKTTGARIGTKKSVLVPIPINKQESSESGSSSEEQEQKLADKKSGLVKEQTKTRQSRVPESSSEEKQEATRIAKKRQSNQSENQKVPKPITLLKQEDSDIGTFSEVDTNDIYNSENMHQSRSSYIHKSQMSWTEMLQEKYPKYQKQNLKLKLPGNAKYSLLLAPKNIEPQSLINLKLHMNKSTSNILKGKEYIFEPLPHKPDPVLVHLNKPKLVVLESIISLQQFVPKLDLQKLEVPETNKVLFPEAIKERHPLFGIDYQKRVKLGKYVKRRLKEANNKRREAEEKMKKKKKKKSNISNTVEEGVLSVFNAINDDLEGLNTILDENKQKRRKKKSNGWDERLEKSARKRKS